MTSAKVSCDSLPDEAWVAALASLPDMWSSRLAAVLGVSRGRQGVPAPPPRRTGHEAWTRVAGGALADDPAFVQRCGPEARALAARWAQSARRQQVERIWQRYRDLGVGVRVLGTPAYPELLASDHDAPYILFTQGDPAVLAGPRAAIVGTRQCTASGREIAAQFGRELAEAGVRVVSGLALGIDGAAHLGALDARAQAQAKGAIGPPIGVVAGGLDRPYPARHRLLWRQVGGAGLLLAQAPLATANEPWRFAARNKVLVALADVVVIVESHSRGGSMVTADLALARGVPVLAVPGSVRSSASVGTNRLLAEGATPVCDSSDILTALSLQPPDPRAAAAQRPPPPTGLQLVLDAVDWFPTSPNVILDRTGLAPPEAAAALAQLERSGWVRWQGGWWERAP